jgi:peptidoglycan/xylan/chitin deacetylase (PgdA/CDA1 family)
MRVVTSRRTVASRPLFVVCVVGLVLLVVAAVTPTAATAATGSRVWVDGHAMTLARPAPLARVLARAGVVPVDGRLLAAVSGAVLDPHADPAALRIGGRRAVLTTASLTMVVRPGDHVEVTNGHDRVESTYLRVDPVPSEPPLPDVERDLWAPGTTGVSANVVGEHSGEVAPRLGLAPSAPASQVPGNVISLTFDDGPDPKFTPRILEILRQAGVHATFCMVGTQARANPALVKAVHDAGHTICDHTEHHPHLDQLSANDVDGEIGSMAAFLQETTGEAPRFFRAPYGGVNDTVVQAAHNHGLRVLGWSSDTNDYQKPAPIAIVFRVFASLHPGAIVIMHDGGGDRTNTVAALPAIINGLKAKSYTIVQPTP